MLIKRRHFLHQTSLAAAGTLLIPKFLQGFHRHPPFQTEGKVLVVIQLSGGNDGLNTIVPFRNDIYYQTRPKLALQASQVIALNDDGGLHPALPFLKTCYQNGELAILNEVGYPNPDRSHFRSMDIWHSASASNEYVHTGWLGRYLDAACAGCEAPTQVLELDDVLSLALKGEKHKGIAFQDPRQLYTTSKSPAFESLAKDHHAGEDPLADFLYRTLADTLNSAELIMEASRKAQTQPDYPDTQLGKNLKTIASLINSDINTSVYYASHGSFDTHINQQMQQNRLFTELNNALEAFVTDLKKQNRFKDVVVMTFSEFGRRVSQNASGGTDHGTANNMFIIGGDLKKPGFFNPLPTLQDLKDGDLQYKIDFRDIYWTMIQNCLKVKPENIMKGSFQNLGFV
jgi:uncharacterized protein (DUF1501 family)